MTAFFGLFLLGLLGSVHCFGMCGPLLTIVPFDRRMHFSHLRDQGIYHFARLMTYSLIGALIGLFSGLVFVNRIQTTLTFIIGLLLILFSISSFAPRISFLSAFQDATNRAYFKFYNKFLTRNNSGSIFISGMLNGFLPCGLVYTAMAMSFLNNTLYSGMIGMLLFGLGTMPLLVLSQFTFKQIAGIKRNINGQLIKGLLTATSGVLMMVKAVHTQLPIETNLWQALLNPIMCH